VFPASSSGNPMLSLKVALISTGVLFLAVILKLPVLVTDFAVSELPIMYSSVISWLQPPYLYLVINCIIISILASSKLQLQKPNQEQQVPLPPADIIVLPVQVTEEEEEDISVRVGSAAYVNEAVVASDRYDDYEYLDVEDKTVIVEDCAVESGEVYEREVNKAAPYRSDSIEFLIEKDQNKEKPLVSARLGRRKSLIKASPEGRSSCFLFSFLHTNKYLFS
jgi:hypothetical protein